MTKTKTIILGVAIVLSAATYLALAGWQDIKVCCPVDGPSTDCYPVDLAADCPGTHMVSECECARTEPTADDGAVLACDC